MYNYPDYDALCAKVFAENKIVKYIAINEVDDELRYAYGYQFEPVYSKDCHYWGLAAGFNLSDYSFFNIQMPPFKDSLRLRPEESEEVKPCPFCGITPDPLKSNFRYNIMHSCDAITTTIGWGKKKDVIARWNHRV